MNQSIALVALVVHDYDEAIRFFTEKLQFVVVEDTVVPGRTSDGSSSPRGVQVAQACFSRERRTPNNEPWSGIRRAGACLFFLNTDDFWRDYRDMAAGGVKFVREPKVEAYGTVAVFEDLYGNRWDLRELAAAPHVRRVPGA